MRPREARDIIMRMYKGDPTDAQKAALDVTYRILDLDLDPDEIQELKERDTAKDPEEFGGHWYKCPTCGKYAGGLKGNFRHVCGQRLKLED